MIVKIRAVIANANSVNPAQGISGKLFSWRFLFGK